MRLTLCDDHGLFVDALATALRCRGHEILAVTHDAESVVDLAARQRPDVWVLDVSFPRSSGLAAAASIRERQPETCLLLLTASAGNEVWDAFDSRLVDGLVSKSCDLDRLDSSIRRVVGGERLVEGYARTSGNTSGGRLRYTQVEPLTSREKEVLRLIVQGASTEMMTASLGVSGNTVRTHVQNVLRKLNVHHRAKAAQRGIELNLVDVRPVPTGLRR